MLHVHFALGQTEQISGCCVHSFIMHLKLEFRKNTPKFFTAPLCAIYYDNSEKESPFERCEQASK